MASYKARLILGEHLREGVGQYKTVIYSLRYLRCFADTSNLLIIQGLYFLLYFKLLRDIRGKQHGRVGFLANINFVFK